MSSTSASHFVVKKNKPHAFPSLLVRRYPFRAASRRKRVCVRVGEPADIALAKRWVWALSDDGKGYRDIGGAWKPAPQEDSFHAAPQSARFYEEVGNIRDRVSGRHRATSTSRGAGKPRART
ncbi:hypothetical protein D6792_03490 [Candidatus Parcubacteria bacterium]|nr:MAG: hypothetical protein D6792_03490 [Candidatus Parcubacteria bacterium]